MNKKWVARITSLLLVFTMVFTLLPSAAFAEENNETFTPKSIFLVGEDNPQGTELAQKASLVSSEFVARGVCRALPIVYGDVSLAKEGDILVKISDELAEEAFTIEIDQGQVALSAGSAISVMYGLRYIMKRLLLQEEIIDWEETPDVEQRIFHLDCGRKCFTKDFMISLVKELSWLQMNQLEVDFSNGTGFRFALDDSSLDVDGDGVGDEDLSVLYGGTTDPDGYLTESDMDEIIQTADEYGVEIVPCLDSPGHTGWIMGKAPFQKYATDGDMDVESDVSKGFMKALIKKYASYFVSKGCTTFHIGGDEFLHAYLNWNPPIQSTESKYRAVAEYLDSLAGELKQQIGVKKIRAFNDPLYYNEDTTTHTWENVDEAEYWCYNGMWGYNHASPTFLGEQGIDLINGHGDFYGILTGSDPNWTKPVGDAGTKKTPAGFYAQWKNTTFAQGHETDIKYVKGSTYFMWCDDPTQGTEQEVAKSLYPRLRASSAKISDDSLSGSFEDFAMSFTDSTGGFTATGMLQEIELPAPPKVEKAVIADPDDLTDLGDDAGQAGKDYPESAKDDYTQEAWEELQEAIKEADKLSKDSSALVTQVTAAKERLEAAITALETAKTEKGHAKDALNGVLNNTELKALLAAENRDKKYTEDSWKELTDAYGEASARVDTAEEEELTTLKDALDAAWKGLVLEKTNDDSGVGKILIGADKTQYKVVSAKEKTVTIIKGVDAKTIKIGPTVVIDKETYKVIGIDSKAYTGLKSAVKVIIGDNVTSIGDEAFANSKKITGITIGKDVKTIGKKAFFKCQKLKKVILKGNALKEKGVGKQAFKKTAKKATVKWGKVKGKARNSLKKKMKQAGLKVK